MNFQNPDYKKRPFGTLIVITVIALTIGGGVLFPKLLKNNDSSKDSSNTQESIISDSSGSSVDNSSLQTTNRVDNDNVENEIDTTIVTSTSQIPTEISANNIEPQDLLNVCPPYKTERYETWSDLSMGGIMYYSGVSIGGTGSWGGEGYALFNLDKKYNMLSFEVGNIDERGVAENQGIFVYLDDRIALSIELIPGALPKRYELDVTGIQQMKIYGSTWAGDYGMVNIKVTEDTGDTENEKLITNEGKSLLSVIQPYKTDNYEEWVNLSIAGTRHASGICVGRTGSWGGEGYALFNLNSSYTSLSFDIGNIDDRGVAEGQILEIYLDDRLVWSHELSPEEMPSHYEVDLTGAKQLKIYGSTWAGDYGLFDIYIQ